MISYLEKPFTEKEIASILNPTIKKWFKSKFKNFSQPQKYAIPLIHNQKNVLVSSPTGSGKTLTAFLSIINELFNLSEGKALEDKIYAIYISPLKALSNDIEINLLKPLQEIEKISKKKHGIRVAVRTGDTSVSEKAKMLKKPPHILICTPETLGIVLSSIKFRENFKDVKYLIMDEVHAIAENKRGVHLSLSIERLKYYVGKKITTIGLSATIAPLDEIAKFLVGNKENCKIIDVQFLKKMDLKVLSPVDDLINITYDDMNSKLYDLMDKLVQDHKTTLIFTNTRAATERVVNHLKDKFPKKYTENIGAHHGSLSKEVRTDLESRLRKGKLKCVVTSTSLELGIDIGYIDLVILLGSPKSVARSLQRIGRSGHKLHETAKGRIIVLDRDDMIECSLILKASIEKKIDRIHIPTNALDVLAQQIVGITSTDQIHIDDLFSLIKSSYCYKDLSKKDFMDVIDYLAGVHTSLEDRHVYAKLWHDKETGMMGKRGKLTRVIYMTNIGTIPDESHIRVKIGENNIGSLDESFLERLKPGDVFMLAGQNFTFRFSRGQTAQVSTSVDRPPTVPSWFSEMLPLSYDLSLEIGRFRKLMEQKFSNNDSKEKILKFINKYLYVDKYASLAIYNYFNEQYLFCNEIPNDKKILIEFYNDREGEKKIIFHSLYGRRINDCFSRSLAYAISLTHKKNIELGINDNGFYINADSKINIFQALKEIKSKDIEPILENAIDKSEILKRRFRHCATRSLMIFRIQR